MLTRGDIWTADLVRAMHDLHPADDNTRDLIAELLGFEPAAPEPPVPPPIFDPGGAIPIATTPGPSAAEQPSAQDLVSRQAALERLPSLPSQVSIGVEL